MVILFLMVNFESYSSPKVWFGLPEMTRLPSTNGLMVIELDK